MFDACYSNAYDCDVQKHKTKNDKTPVDPISHENVIRTSNILLFEFQFIPKTHWQKCNYAYFAFESPITWCECCTRKIFNKGTNYRACVFKILHGMCIFSFSYTVCVVLHCFR